VHICINQEARLLVAGVSRDLSSSDARPRQLDEVGDVNLGRNAGVSRDQLDQLRQDIRSSLNETLFTRLHNMEEVTAQLSLRALAIHCVVNLCAFCEVRVMGHNNQHHNQQLI